MFSMFSMDWFQGKPTGNHRFSHQIMGLTPVKFPLNQSTPLHGTETDGQGGRWCWVCWVLPHKKMSREVDVLTFRGWSREIAEAGCHLDKFTQFTGEGNHAIKAIIWKWNEPTKKGEKKDGYNFLAYTRTVLLTLLPLNWFGATFQLQASAGQSVREIGVVYVIFQLGSSTY